MAEKTRTRGGRPAGRAARLTGRAALLVLSLFVSLELGLRVAGRLHLERSVRDARASYRPEAGAYRILCIGESTTWGDKQGAYPPELQKILEGRYPGRKFQVFNFGVPAVTVPEIVRHFPANLSATDPNLVILQVGHNAMGPSMFFYFGEGLGNALAGVLNASSAIRFLRLLKDVAVGFLMTDLHWRGFYADVYLVVRRGDAFDPQRRAEQRKGIEKLIAECRRRRIEVVMAGYFVSDANPFLRDAAREFETPFCDLRPSLLRYRAAGREAELFGPDRWHPSGLGYRVIAENLAPLVYAAIVRRAVSGAAGRD